ncbi:hypothetical protein [Actinomadura litoris]|uniref:hypothetical protein n=1 Tax=Actinomadura litoris TaxID=2678616 RepID=UPI001FA74F79|nr:hypothetical protein [Actinomadura litoris]
MRMSTRTLADGRRVSGRVRLVALGAVLGGWLALATAIEYGLAAGHEHAGLASAGHGPVSTQGDGTALGLGRY